MEPSATQRSQMSDAELVAAIRAGCPRAARAFDERFRPILEAYARRVRIPPGEWNASITDVMTDEVIRLGDPAVSAPASLGGYLVRSLRHRYLNDLRAAGRRARRHAAAADDGTGEWVVTSLCSENALRTSAGPDDRRAPTRAVLERLAGDLRSEISEEEHAILMWISQGASHVEIARWLGASYESSTKRIWRLCQRLRVKASDRAATYSPPERSELERFLRRAGDLPNNRRMNASA